MSEPNTTDLGALRERLDGIRERYHSGVWPNGGLGDVLDDAFKDVRWLLAAYDVQAARLAAQQPVVDAVLKLSTYSRETVDDGVRRIVQASDEYEEWLLATGAVGAGEARDGE